MNVYRVESDWSVAIVRATTAGAAERAYLKTIKADSQEVGMRPIREAKKVTKIELLGQLRN